MWKIHELCMENVRKRDIRHHDKCEAMYYHKAGSLCILQMSMGRKVVSVLGICGLFTNLCAKLTQSCAQGILCCSEHFSLVNPQEVCLTKKLK